MNLVERIDNLTDEQRKLILIKTRKDMEKVLQEAKMGRKLEEWVQNLSLKDRLMVQKFMVKLYGMEKNDGKD